MPPVAVATTAVSQAMASRFTMPIGSYTDGHTNTVAWVRIWTTSALGSISEIQTTPALLSRSPSTSPATSAAISGVSGAPAQSTSWASGAKDRAARSRWTSPFCRVMRPTKTTYGLAGSMPCASRTPVPGSGAYSPVSMPLWITVTRPGAISG